MRDVFLVRHGKAAASAVGGDAARPLTDEGRRELERAGAGLRALGVRPDVVLHSPFVRAVETARLLADALDVEQLVSEGALTPVGSGESAARAIAQAPGRSLLVVSHMPLLPALALELVGARLDFGTGTVAHLALAGPHGSALCGLWSCELLGRLGADAVGAQ